MNRNTESSPAPHDRPEPDFQAKLPPAHSGGLWIARLVLLIFGMFWLAGVGSFAGELLKDTWRGARRALVWQQTPGSLTQVEEIQDSNDSNVLEVRYSYRVEDTSYESSHTFKPTGASESPAPESLEPGRELQVWYDPRRPVESTLDPAEPVYPLAFLIFMLPFLLIGLAMVAGGIFGTLGLEVLEKRARTGPLREARAMLTGAAAFGILSAVGTFAVIALGRFLDWPSSWLAGLTVFAAVPVLSIGIGLLDGWRRNRLARAEAMLRDQDGVADVSRELLTPAKNLPPVGWPLIGFWAFWTAIVAIFIVHALAGILVGYRGTREYLPVEAEVISAEVRKAPQQPGSYVPHIVYRYQVGGQTYTSDRFQVSDGPTTSQAQARRVLERFPPGKKVQAWYDSKSPTQAVLRRRSSYSAWYLLLFLQPFLAVSLGGAAAIWLSLRHRGAVARFLRQSPSEVLAIPGWGSVRQMPGQLEVVARPAGVLVGIALGGAYLGICFLGAFLLAFILGNTPPGPWVAGVFVSALAAGILTARLVSGRLKCRKLTLQLDSRRLVLEGEDGQSRSLDLANIRAFRCGKDEDTDSSDLLHHAQIQAVLTDGTRVLIARMPGDDRLLTARRACDLLGQWTGKPVQKAPEESTD